MGRASNRPNRKETEMSDKETLQNLCSVINGCLPYEYDVKLLDYHGRNPRILIVKEDSDHIMQISTSKHSDTFTVFSYDDGDDPDTDGEVYQWDLDSPDSTLDSILADIKNRL